MLKIAVTGASSFIGSHLLENLSRKNITINALSRNVQPTDIIYNNVTRYSGNLLEKKTLINFIKGCDVVVNLSYLWEENCAKNLEAINNLAILCADHQIKRLIHCSTTSVYGNIEADVVDENAPCSPQTQYSKTKLAIENYLLENHAHSFEIAILRPTQVFGPKGKNLVKLAHNLTQGFVIKNYLKSCLMAKRPMNLVCVDNVIGALDYLIHLKDLREHVYIISDDEIKENNFQHVENYLMNQLQTPPYFIPQLPLPLFLYKNFYRLICKGTINPNIVYLGKNLTKSGYIKPVSFEEGLTKFINWYNCA